MGDGGSGARNSAFDETAPGPPAGASLSPPAGAELPGGLRLGEYQIQRVIGRGGMATVYAGVQPVIGKSVAVKVLSAQLSGDAAMVKRFVDEARAVNKIRHPNIIDIFAFGRLPDGRQYFVMEYLQGETLASRMERGPLPFPEARRLLVQICEALQAAHMEQIIHRDLKPDNLWIAIPKHGEPYVKILDFGIAKLVEDRGAGQSTEAGVAMGTAHFMSPEQCRGEGVDHRTDIYAMGVILYLMFAGRLPFEGRSFIEVLTQQITTTPASPAVYRSMPEAMEQLILTCLEKDPARRPQSAQALGQAIALALQDAPAGAPAASRRNDPTLVRGAGMDPTIVRTAEGPAPGAPGQPAPGSSGRQRSLVIVAVAVVSLAGVGTWLVRRTLQGPTPTTTTTLAPAPVAPAAPPPAPALGNAAPAASAPASAVADAAATSPAATVTPESPTRPGGKRAKPRVTAPSDPTRPPSRAKDRGFSEENPYR